MNLDNMVLSLELAKKLQDLNIKNQSIFYWLCNLISNNWYLSMCGGFDEKYHSEAISAFTGDELLTLLPHRITSKNHEEPFNSFIMNIQKHIVCNEEDNFNFIYCINYLCDTFNADMLDKIANNPFIGNLFHKNIYDKKFSDALAKILIKLIEDNLIEKKAGK